MIVEIDATSTVPPYDQLREQIGTMIAAGTLAVGTRLPPIRQLAKDLELAPGTVARAYRELEHLGLIEARGRKGSFVAERGAVVAPDRDEQLRAAARSFAATAAQLGVDPADAEAAVRDELSRLAPAG